MDIQGLEIQKDRLYQQIADQIEKSIILKKMNVGERLPSERDLAERLGVSRTIIREAIKILGVRGLVEVRHGSGTYITEITSESASTPIKRYLSSSETGNVYAKLYEVRRSLEIDIAGLAAQRATEEDLEQIEGALEKQEKAKNQLEVFTRADFAFHSALAAATHNELYSMLLAAISDLMLEFRSVAYQSDPEGSIRGALVFHKKLLKCMKDQNAEKARQVMQEHLDQGNRIYCEAVLEE